jgi:hypothetical protein
LNPPPRKKIPGYFTGWEDNIKIDIRATCKGGYGENSSD